MADILHVGLSTYGEARKVASSPFTVRLGHLWSQPTSWQIYGKACALLASVEGRSESLAAAPTAISIQIHVLWGGL